MRKSQLAHPTGPVKALAEVRITFIFLDSSFAPFATVILRLYKIGLFDWYADQGLRKRNLGLGLALCIRIVFFRARFGYFHLK